MTAQQRQTRYATLTDLRLILGALRRLRRAAIQAQSTDDAMALWSVCRQLEARVAQMGDLAIQRAEDLIG